MDLKYPMIQLPNRAVPIAAPMADKVMAKTAPMTERKGAPTFVTNNVASVLFISLLILVGKNECPIELAEI